MSSGAPSNVALTVITVVTGAGMGQLFKGSSYLGPVILVALVTHALCYGLRHAKRLPAVLAGPLTVLAVVLVSTWLVFFGATRAGIFDSHTFSVISDALVQARLDFANLRAPVAPTPGFEWLACLGIGFAGLLADTAAFRLGAPFEGVLPAFAVFLFTAGLGTSGGRSAPVALWIVAVLAYFLVVELRLRTQGARWLDTDDPPPAPWRAHRDSRSPALAGGILGLLAVLCGLLIGPTIPGATSVALISSASDTGNPANQRTTISPLVSIKAELLSPSDATVFDVASPVPRYWRLTSLDRFDGVTWSADASYQPVTTSLPSTPGPEASTTVTQRFHITGLDETWLPAAFRPVALSGLRGASFNQASASLITTSPTHDGLSYTVTSDVPGFTPAELRTARVTTGADLSLPAALPSSIVGLARQVTAGDTTPYAKALSLQNYFRANFTYSLSVPASDSTNALVEFLFHTHAGFCQQFAGAYAVMARAVGLPSRVAVGFTPGQLGSNGVYHVEALDAHAWPELDLGSYGWVPFEPTPGRGQPGTAYTGVAPAQANPQAPAAAVSAPAATPVTAPLGPLPSSHRPARHPSPTPRRSTLGAGSGWGALDILGSLAGVLGGGLALLALLGGLRRRRRWIGARTGPDAALAGFAEVCDQLSRCALGRNPAETLTEYVARVAPRLPAQVGEDLTALCGYAESAAYSPRTLAADDPGEVRRLRQLSERIGAAIRTDMTWRRRVLRWFDPRSALRPSKPELQKLPDWARLSP